MPQSARRLDHHENCKYSASRLSGDVAKEVVKRISVDRLMTNPDAWGRVTSPVEPVEPVDVRPSASRRGEAWAMALARGLIFLGGMFYALLVAFYLGYSGKAPMVVFWAELALAPASVVFWFLASFTDAGDSGPLPTSQCVVSRERCFRSCSCSSGSPIRRSATGARRSDQHPGGQVQRWLGPFGYNAYGQLGINTLANAHVSVTPTGLGVAAQSATVAAAGGGNTVSVTWAAPALTGGHPNTGYTLTLYRSVPGSGVLTGTQTCSGREPRPPSLAWAATVPTT